MSLTSIPRILVVDDDHDVMAAYRCALKSDTPDAKGGKESVNRLGAELFAQPVKQDDDAMTWRVNFAYQGQDAFDAVCAAVMKSDPFAIVFLDIRMPPGIDGCETARRIRQVDPFVHIVFVSGYSGYTEEELAEAAGPADKVSFLQKPIGPQQLRSKALELCRAA